MTILPSGQNLIIHQTAQSNTVQQWQGHLARLTSPYNKPAQENEVLLMLNWRKAALVVREAILSCPAFVCLLLSLHSLAHAGKSQTRRLICFKASQPEDSAPTFTCRYERKWPWLNLVHNNWMVYMNINIAKGSSAAWPCEQNPWEKQCKKPRTHRLFLPRRKGDKDTNTSKEHWMLLSTDSLMKSPHTEVN